jgi:hypothetical protein
VLADPRGYGGSAKPAAGGDHAEYSKRAMGADQVAVMASPTGWPAVGGDGQSGAGGYLKYSGGTWTRVPHAPGVPPERDLDDLRDDLAHIPGTRSTLAVGQVPLAGDSQYEPASNVRTRRDTDGGPLSGTDGASRTAPPTARFARQAVTGGAVPAPGPVVPGRS